MSAVRAPILGGTNDTGLTTLEAARRDAVVYVASAAGQCTGTLITPRVVLTSQHCAKRTGNVVQFGIRRSQPIPNRVGAIGCIPEPGSTECGTPVVSRDVALLVLERRVDADPATGLDRSFYRAIPAGLALDDPPNPVTGLPDAAQWIGREVTAVGYGLVDGDVLPTYRQRKLVEVVAVTSHDVSIDSATTVPGDSGGPSYLGDPASGAIAVLGVHRNPSVDERLTDSVTRAWLESQLTNWRGIYLGPVDVPLAGEAARTPAHDTIDPDGDGLAATHDNCPSDSNPSQVDADLDGLGDACDLCVGYADRTFTDADGDGFNDDTCDDCPSFDSGVDTNGDGVVDARLDTDGDGISDACDICVARVDRPGAPNCNRDAEIAAGAPELPDACDPTPCPEGSPLAIAAEHGIPPLTSVFENSSIQVFGRMGEADARFGYYDVNVEAGARFCPCDVAIDDTVDSRNDCAAFAGCAIEPSAFEVPEPSLQPWKVMRLGSSSAGCAISPYGDLRCAVQYARPDPLIWDWDFIADAADWGVDANVGLYERAIRGVTWSHSEGALTKCHVVGGCDPAEYDDEVPSHYWSGEIRMEPREVPPGWEESDIFLPSFLPPGDCIACRAASRLAWLVADPCVRAGTCGLAYARVRYPGFDRKAQDLVSPGAVPVLRTAERWLGANDVFGIVPSGHPVSVALAGNSTEIKGTLVDVSGVLQDGSGHLGGLVAIPVGAAQPPFGFTSQAAVYSAQDATVLVLGVPVDADTAELWRVDVANGHTMQLMLRLPDWAELLTAVHAMARRPHDHSLIALVEFDKSHVHIVRLPLDGSPMEVLREQIAEGSSAKYEQHAIAFDGLGNILLIGYGPEGFSVAGEPTEDRGSAPFAGLARSQRILLPPVSDRDGVSFIAAGQGFGEVIASGFAEHELVPGNFTFVDAY